jgi:hypothetical protein
MTASTRSGMDHVPAIGDRRTWPRVAGHHVRSARLVPGHPVHVIDLSPGGALIETACRLLPGTHVELQLGSLSQFGRARARIVRCQVSVLDRHRGISYRGALAFETPLAWEVNTSSG